MQVDPYYHYLPGDDPIPCHVCKILTNGVTQYQDHLVGKTHRRNLRLLRRFRDGYDKTTGRSRNEEGRLLILPRRLLPGPGDPTADALFGPVPEWATPTGGPPPASDPGVRAGREPTPPPPGADGPLMPTEPYPSFLENEPIDEMNLYKCLAACACGLGGRWILSA